MKIAIPREAKVNERRVPVVPAGVAMLVEMGAEVGVEAGVGRTVNAPDSSYEDAGASVVGDRATLLRDAEVVLRLNPPPTEEVEMLAAGTIHISYLDPFFNQELVRALAARDVKRRVYRADPTHDAGAEDGRAELASEPGRLCRCGAGCRTACPYLPDDDDPCRHPEALASLRDRCRCGRLASHRHGQAYGRSGQRLRYAPGS